MARICGHRRPFSPSFVVMSTVMGDFLKPDGFSGPAGLRALAREGSAVVEIARYARRRRTDSRERSDRPYVDHRVVRPVEPVLLIPGFMAGDGTLAGMAQMLRHHGYRTYRSGIHVNVGCTRQSADRLERRLEAVAERRGRKVTIVGHSLGGMLARGLAARRPDLVAGIVAMGSPILAPAAVHGVLVRDAELLTRLTRAGFGGMMGADCISGSCAEESFEETHRPLAEGLGFTAIYSKRDGIVDWRACLDPAAVHVEVTTSHCGMAVDPVCADHVLSALREQAAARATAAETQCSKSMLA